MGVKQPISVQQLCPNSPRNVQHQSATTETTNYITKRAMARMRDRVSTTEKEVLKILMKLIIYRKKGALLRFVINI